MKAKRDLIRLFLIIGIFIFSNLLIFDYFARLDLTKDGIYSLSQASIESVKNLEDKLVIKAYFSKDLQGNIANARQYTLDILNEYKAFSDGRLAFEFADPNDTEKFKQEAQKNGLSPLTMRVNENDKIEIREVYLGLVFLYGDKSEVIPAVASTKGLEYTITSTIKRISNQKSALVGFYNKLNLSAESVSSSEKYEMLQNMVKESYNFTEVNLDKAVPKDVSVLIFTGVADSLDNLQLVNLDQYIMNGGKVMFFQEAVMANIQSQSAKPIESNLLKQLESYGLKLKPNLVADAQCGEVTVQQRQGIFTINKPVKYPFLPIITSFNKNHPLLKNSEQMQMVFASEIDTTNTNSKLKITSLFTTTEHSDETKPPYYNIGLNQNFAYNKGKKVVAALYEGQFNAYFKLEESFDIESHKNTVDNTSLMLIADSDFIKDSGTLRVPGNARFVQNAIDYLSGDKAMITLRSREVLYRPLKNLKASEKKIVKWINIILPSLLLILYGLLRFFKEMKKRKRLREMYNG